MRLLDLVTWLTTPLVPEDYVGLVNPLWSVRPLRGRVEAVRAEAGGATTLVIRPGRGWDGHRAGQYVGVGTDLAGTRRWRTYSVSSPPGSECITITVKPVDGGLVSPRLVRLAPGTIVQLAPPAGEFVLPEPAPARLLMLSAGSGITPIMSILRDLAHRDVLSDVVLVHSARTPAEVIFGAELRGLATRFPGLRLIERHTRTSGRLTVADLPDLCPDWRVRHAMACGPGDLLDDLERHWADAGIRDRLHVERFRRARAPAGGRGGHVRFSRSGLEAVAAAGVPLLEVGEAAGVLMPSGCRMGICYSCVARVRSGRVRDLRTGTEHGEEGELVQTCVSAASGAVEIDL